MTQVPDREIAALEERFQNEPGGRLFAPLADAYRKTGNLTRARAVVEQGLLRHPAYATGHVIAGWVFRDSGDSGSALQAFVRALELDPDNVVALRNLAELEDAGGQTGEAVQHYRRLVELGIDDATVMLRLKELGSAEPEEVAAQPVADEPADLGLGLEEVGLEGWTAGAASLTVESEPSPGETALDVEAFQVEEAEPAEVSPQAGAEVRA
ncbi:MAG: tetratricopeptide repeat protein, partial [Gemmatimonadetes bacterium]|nr:tetratricopeptide repeat protein [Gemmatimonadota bacterium]